MVQVMGLSGIPMVKPGDELGHMVVEAAERLGVGIKEGDVIVVAQKVVSKAEGRLIHLRSVKPSSFALWVASQTCRDPRLMETILR